VDAVVGVMVVILAAAVVYLGLQLRHYQRIDYSFLLEQDERERRTSARIKTLEKLVGDLTQFEALRRAEMTEMLSASQRQLEMQASLLREMLVEAAQTQAPLGASSPQSVTRRHIAAAPDARAGLELQFPALSRDAALMPSRERAIRIQLARGHDGQRIARELGVSMGEVELVRAKKPASRSA
jgi:hypothetical protein